MGVVHLGPGVSYDARDDACDQCPKRLCCLRCCGVRALYGTRIPPRMGRRTRQEGTTLQLRLSCDLTVVRSQVRVAFANTHLILVVRVENHEHEQKAKTQK